MVNYHENVYARRGTSGRDHIPASPFWLAIIRVIQLVFAFIVLVLTAYSSNAFGGSPDGSIAVNDLFPGYSMSYFTFTWTVLFLIYIFLTPLVFPQFYLSYVHLVLEFLTVVFWLTTFALLADECKWWVAEQHSLNRIKHAYKNFDTPYGHYDHGEINKLLTAAKASRAATGIAAIVWILFMVTFGFVVLFWNNHRVGRGGTGLPFGHRGGAGPNSGVEAPQAEKTHAPVELNNV